MIETAVSQLFDVAVRHPHGGAVSGEFGIDDLARLAGTTTRNIRSTATADCYLRR